MLEKEDLKQIENIIDKSLDSKLKPIKADILGLKEEMVLFRNETEENFTNVRKEMDENFTFVREELNDFKSELTQVKSILVDF